MIAKATLEKMYLDDGASMRQIADALHCSPHKVIYWMTKHSIQRRSRDDACYIRRHPFGDPFISVPVSTPEQALLQGIGIGLYWGEGTKANKYNVRLGNTDPALLNTFMKFLIELYSVNRKDFRFGLQIFTDIDPQEALQYWAQQLGVNASQFYKIIVTISGSIGTYRHKSKYGVVTVYYNNKKLRDKIVNLLPR